MKKIAIILMFFLLPQIKSYTQPSISDIDFSSSCVAGEDCGLFFIINNDEQVRFNNYHIVYAENIPEREATFYSDPFESTFILETPIYVNPGQFIGNIHLYDNDYEAYYPFTVNVLPNPEPAPPVVYPISDFHFKQDTIYTIDLSRYVSDINGDDITWTATTTEPNIIVDIEDDVATISATTNWNGEGDIQFHASDGTFTVDSDTVTVKVLDFQTVSGMVSDIFTGDPVPNVTVIMKDPWIGDQYGVTDDEGKFNVDIHTHDYVPVYFYKDDYTPFHTWYDYRDSTLQIKKSGTINTSQNKNANSLLSSHREIQEFKLIPSSFKWDLYNYEMRASIVNEVPFEMSLAPSHWKNPPEVHVSSDNSLVGGVDLTTQYNNLIYNLNNILLTFAQTEYDPSKIVEHTEPITGLNMNNFVKIYFDNSIGAAGTVVIIREGYAYNKCIIQFYHYVGLGGPDNDVFNQEIGTCFGAVFEPPLSSNYVSVFTDPAMSNTYTEDDLNCQYVRMHRSKVHYLNKSYDYFNDPEAWDWEMRPDEVEFWYSSKKNSAKTFTYKVFNFDGSIESHIYTYDNVPLEIMKQFKDIFSEKEIEEREAKEREER